MISRLIRTSSRWTLLGTMTGCLVTTSCDKSESESKSEPERQARKTVPVSSRRRAAIKLNDIPSPAQATWTVKAGDDPFKIAMEVYGHRAMSGLLTTYNGIGPVNQLTEGQVLKTPSLATIFHETNPGSDDLQTLYRLAKDYEDFRALLPDYLEQRKAQQKSPEAGKIVLTPKMEAELKRLADSVEEGGHEIERASFKDPIQKIINVQLQQAVMQLRGLATGAVDAEGKDYDLVLQRMGYAFRASLAWLKKSGQS